MRFLFLVVLVLAFALSTQAQTGVRIRIVAYSEMPGVARGMEPTDTTIVSAQGPRIRTELSPSKPSQKLGQIVSIQRCDTRVAYVFNQQKREYMEVRMPSPEKLEQEKKTSQQKRGDGPPNLVIEITSVDTGETKQAFGHTAHHYITTTKQIPSAELGQDPSEVVEDAWYLDAPDITTCEPTHRVLSLIAVSVSNHINGGVRDARTPPKLQPDIRHHGPFPQGLVLSSKHTTRSVHVLQNGEKQETTLSSSREIVEMSEVRIGPALFDVPSGFTKVEQFSQ
jgi:hypothetical protein